MEAQSASAVLLVRPAAFGFNVEAARTNAFSLASTDPQLQRKAASEFDGLARRLSGAGVEVLVLDDSADPAKPDAVFPNNWFSTHADGTLVVYPMATAPRRLERRVDALTEALAEAGFKVERLVDLTSHEEDGRYLEGTGSLVLDRPNKRAYANLSLRTDADVIADFDRALGYSTFVFDARDPGGQPIYHTNVVLSLGCEFAMLCVDAIAAKDRPALIKSIDASGRAIVELDFEQLKSFGCNLLELRNSNGEPVIALSETARKSLRLHQLQSLESFGELVVADIPTIEAVGGGSVRCMIAELHLPRR